MKWEGVRRAVLPSHLQAEAAHYGILPVEVYPLRRAVLPQLLDLFLPLTGKTAALCAPCLTPEVEAAGCELARRARYLRLDIGQGREALAQHLFYRFGLTEGGRGETALTVSFGGEKAGRCVHLGEDCARFQQIRYGAAEGAMEDIEMEEMRLSALFQGGYLPKEAICVKSIFTKP